ncbi:MAG: PQQ-dependent sugar dehydrogenase [Planctomycetes bacterium]|nr:PQQ-dependent sugar dehydrogenase [Planctomycetota bacterium]
MSESFRHSAPRARVIVFVTHAFVAHALFATVSVALFVGARPATAADVAPDPRAHIRSVEDRLADAARALVDDDRAAARTALASASASASATEDFPRQARAVLSRLRARIERVGTVLGAAGDDLTPSAFAIRDAAGAARAVARRLEGDAAAPLDLIEVGGRTGAVHRPGRASVFRVVPASCAADARVDVVNDDDQFEAIVSSVQPLGRGRFRVRWGPDLGTARVIASACGATYVRRALNLGPPGALAVAAPSGLDYGATVFARVGGVAPSAGPSISGTGPFLFTVTPDLPAGLTLDPATGATGGAATTAGPATVHRVTARNVRGSVSSDLTVDPDPALPAAVVSLAGGFAIEEVVAGAVFPSKIAPAPDGRVFYDELQTGRIRVVGADGVLRAEPFATVPIQTGSEQGLLGIALAPDFAASGHVYVFATTPPSDGRPARNRILRFTGAGDVATSGPDVVVDDLPTGDTQNAGVLRFGPDGKLYVTTGDTGDAALSQADGSLAGRVLRYGEDGTVPSDGPVPGSPEWARGFRNCFGLAFQPGTGRLFVTENGPNAHDELDFVLPGRNFEWGAPPDASFGSLRGIRLIDWTPVIVPTGAAFHPGPGFGPEYADNLFFGSYDLTRVRRIVLSGIDVESETTFVQFDESDFVNKPLDVAVGPEGELWVSTFASIWRIRRD